MPAGHQCEKTPEGGEVFDRCHGAHIALQIRLEIGAEPQTRALRPRDHLGIAAAQKRDAGRFTRRKRKQVQHRRAPRHRLRHALHQWRFLRTGQKPLARAARLPVDARPNISEYFGHVLDFVQNCRRFHRVEKAMWIGLEACDDIRVFEQKITRLGKKMSKQPGFSSPPRPGQDQRRKTAHSAQDLRFKGSPDILHI